MSINYAHNTPRLVVLNPAHLRGRTLTLGAADILVGRGTNAQLVLDDPHVSRTHATVRRAAGQVVVQDLGSSAGTTVNGRPATRATPLHDGDIVIFGTVTARYETSASTLDETRIGAVPRYEQPAPRDVRYDIGHQHGGVVSNVAGNQHNSYVQHIVQERHSFLRDIAATKTKARGLCWIGFLLKTFGAIVWGVVIFTVIDRVSADPWADPPTLRELLGPPIWGIEAGIYGIVAIGLGSTLLVVGIVLHIVAAARRRRVDREFPVPHPALGR